MEELRISAKKVTLVDMVEQKLLDYELIPDPAKKADPNVLSGRSRYYSEGRTNAGGNEHHNGGKPFKGAKSGGKKASGTSKRTGTSQKSGKKRK